MRKLLRIAHILDIKVQLSKKDSNLLQKEIRIYD